MRILTILLLSIALANFGSVPVAPMVGFGQANAAHKECGQTGTARVRTTLYFGLSRPAGTIADAEWQAFLRDQVTPKFPEGLTVWEADGQWQRSDSTIGRERAKVLLLVHDGKAKAQAALAEIVGRYKQKFQQESVLWESARICAAF